MTKPSFTIGSVFHPTGLLPRDEAALCHALKIALAGSASLTIFHRPDPDADDAGFPSLREILERWGKLPAGSDEAAVRALGLAVRKIEGHGPDPVRAAAHYLHSHAADLMVLATEARHGLPRLLDPSVAEPLARSADCMSLFVPDGARGLVDPATGKRTLKRILIPFDTEPEPQAALWGAVALANALGQAEGELHGLHVGPASRLKMLAGPQLAGWFWHSEARQGLVVDSILQRAEELDADLIVMATRGHDGLLDALRGSVTEQVLRRARRPLLAVPVRES